MKPTPERCQEELGDLLPRLAQRFEADYLETRDYWRGKGNIAFIQVPSQYRRKGIGTLLYLAASQRALDLGVDFYSSMTKSKEAEAVWKHFHSEGLAERKRCPYGAKTVLRPRLKRSVVLCPPDHLFERVRGIEASQEIEV